MESYLLLEVKEYHGSTYVSGVIIDPPDFPLDIWKKRGWRVWNSLESPKEDLTAMLATYENVVATTYTRIVLNASGREASVLKVFSLEKITEWIIAAVEDGNPINEAESTG